MIKAPAKSLSTITPQMRIPEIRIKHNFLGELATASRKDTQQTNVIITELKNRLNKVFGKEIFKFIENENKLFGTLLEIEPEYRQKSFRFGELLRLSSIMAILENSIKALEIYSKKNAIYFHSKYKFEPAIRQYQDSQNALKSVVENCKAGFEGYKAEAETLLERFQTTESNEKREELCKETNAFLKKYIQKVLETKDKYKSHPFNIGMRMILTDETIKENADFFNKLFQKHEIDYKI